MSNSKYTDEELQQMAITLLAAELRGDPRAVILMDTLAQHYQLHPAHIREWIIDLSGMRTVHAAN